MKYIWQQLERNNYKCEVPIEYIIESNELLRLKKYVKANKRHDFRRTDGITKRNTSTISEDEIAKYVCSTPD